MLAALSLGDGVCLAMGVVPYIFEGETLVCFWDPAQALEHACAGDSVVRPDPVNGQDGAGRVCLGGRGQGVHYSFHFFFLF